MTTKKIVGSTPIYAIHNDIYLKCEWQNLTGTAKTRLIYERIKRLEAEGILTPGITIYDVSTGSEAAALAQFGAMRGYKVKVWLPDYAESGFVNYIRRFGTEVNFVDGDNWLLEGAKRAQEAAESSSGLYFNQADALEDAVKAYGQLGKEFSKQLEQKGIIPKALICVIGSGGLLLGSVKGMRKNFPDLKVFGIELSKAPYLHASVHGYDPNIESHHVWGIGSEESTRMKKELESIVDDVLLIDEEEMRRRVESIPREHGISVDYPTASNIMGSEMLCHNGITPVATIWTGHGWRTLL